MQTIYNGKFVLLLKKNSTKNHSGFSRLHQSHNINLKYIKIEKILVYLCYAWVKLKVMSQKTLLRRLYLALFYKINA